MVVDSIDELNSLFAYIDNRRCLIVLILTDPTQHACRNNISCIYVYTEDDIERIVPIRHTEQITGFSEHVQQFLDLSGVFVYDKKIWLHMGGNADVYDIKTLWWYTYEEPYDESHYIQPAHRFYHRRSSNIPHINCVIPIMQHAAMCQKIRKFAWPMIQNTTLTDSYIKFNSVYPQVFAKIEQTGLHVNAQYPYPEHVVDNFVYTNYNYFTATGRPSNAFRGFNFAAMNKEDGTRSAFCSRFDGGVLVEMDFDAYHVRLIARLISYKLPADSVHTYFGKFYFDADTLTAEQYEQSKQITFRLLYGGIDSEFLSIPFFSEVNAFITNLWATWKRQGYIETAIDKRPLTRDAFPDMTKNKLFNYYLQSLETEVSVRKLQLLLDYMSGMQSKLILYTYDSMLFDVDPVEYDEFTQSARSILTTGNLPVKVAKGHIYSKMQEI
jgi:hypothetical protein